MVYFVGLDVSVKATSVCVVDDVGKVVLEQRSPTEPADIIAVLTSLGVSFGRIRIEAGPLSQWLINGLMAADLPVMQPPGRGWMNPAVTASRRFLPRWQGAVSPAGD